MPNFKKAVDKNPQKKGFHSISSNVRQTNIDRGEMTATTARTHRTRIRQNLTPSENADFNCNICGKSFQRSYNRKMHMAVHVPYNRISPRSRAVHSMPRLSPTFKQSDMDQFRHSPDTGCGRGHEAKNGGWPVASSRSYINVAKLGEAYSRQSSIAEVELGDEEASSTVELHEAFKYDTTINESLRNFPKERP